MRLTSVALLIMLLAGSAAGQQKTTNPHGFPADLRNQCNTCHTCSTPTKLDPCLIACPRVKESTGYHSPEEAPATLVMNKMTKQYGPVVFSHRAHAQMAEMSGGCYGCHHYNSTSMRIMACRECHSADRKRTAVNVPDLKGAYHRQCLDCHRQWSGTTECKTCHLEPVKNNADPKQVLAERAREAKPHPPVPVPERKVYQTPGQNNTVVTFFHSDHAKTFGLKCVDCHRQEGCIRCHDKRPTTAVKAAGATNRSIETAHARCSSCHAQDKCETCHAGKELTVFDHGRATGWALNRFHTGLACTACHAEGKRFTALNPTCTSCHRKWELGSFSHAVTGLTLDETHGQVECAECHKERDFSKPPQCAGCHDDKTYPRDKPGKATKH